MTSTVLRNVRVVDTRSPYHNQVVDIQVVDNEIVAIGAELEVSDAVEHDLSGKSISPGWVEMHSNFADPGHEERENILSGASAAMRGGFSTVCLTSTTSPIIDTKNDIEYIYAKAEGTPVNLFPLGALSKGGQGVEMSEMYDMFTAGAVGFSDDKSPVLNPNLLRMAMLYGKPHDMPIISFPFEPSLASAGQVNEGHTGTYLGMKGIPNLSEEVMVSRDLELLAYTEGHLHLSCVSTAGSVERIRKAKAMGLDVTCDVNLYNLVFTDEVLHDYETVYKVLPPVRSEDDRKALIEGVLDGTIDAIAIDHTPLDIERKMCEFEHADFGMAYLEHAFGVYGSQLASEIPLDRWVECVTHGPREAYRLGSIEIVEGNQAEFTVFETETTWSDAALSATNSLAFNQPFIGAALKGKAVAIFNKGTLFSNL